MFGSKKRSILYLLFLSPITAEVLSGSTKLYAFLSLEMYLIGLPLLITLYGFGALIIKEVSLRARSRWYAVLLLGMAYGIAEEGIATKTFFNPEWRQVGLLGHYGRFFGINIYWALNLTIFHAFISITIPILIVEAISGDKARVRWLSNRSLIAVFVVYLITVVLFNINFPYTPYSWQYLLCLFLIVLLVILAFKTSIRYAPKIEISNRWLQVLGITWTFIFLIATFLFPKMGVYFPAALVFVTTYNIFYGLLYKSALRNSTHPRMYAVASGPIYGFAAFWLLTWDPERVLVATIFIALMLIINNKIKRSVE